MITFVPQSYPLWAAGKFNGEDQPRTARLVLGWQSNGNLYAIVNGAKSVSAAQLIFAVSRRQAECLAEDADRRGVLAIRHETFGTQNALAA